MYKLLASILFFALLSPACKKEKTNIDIHTYEYFSSNLKAMMDFTEIRSTFGEPTSDIGSGIHIYVYKLTDATEIWIGYTDHILYARHVDSNRQILHTLI